MVVYSVGRKKRGPDEEKPLPQTVRAAFSNLREIGRTAVHIGNGRYENYQLYQGRFRGVPKTNGEDGP
jgi:hypothetical protein